MVKILVVDDMAPLRASLRRTLKTSGFTIIEAEHGKEALKLVEQNAPELVLTDLLMPEMEGLELIKRLGRSNPQLPIIAMSGSGETAYLMAAQRLGAVQTLQKPFTEEELNLAIAKALTR